MDTKLIVAPEAEQDIDGAYAWYEMRRRGLGAEFLDCVDACLQVVLRWPLSQEIVHKTIVEHSCAGFPMPSFMNLSTTL